MDIICGHSSVKIEELHVQSAGNLLHLLHHLRHQCKTTKGELTSNNLLHKDNVLPGQICLLFDVFLFSWSLSLGIDRKFKDMPQGHRIFTTQQI